MSDVKKHLAKKHQVRIVLLLKGRQKAHLDRGVLFLNEIHEEFMKEAGSLASKPTERNLSLTYNPKS